jgi:hypothetical protein
LLCNWIVTKLHKIDDMTDSKILHGENFVMNDNNNIMPWKLCWWYNLPHLETVVLLFVFQYACANND